MDVADATGRRTTLSFGLGGQLLQVRDGNGHVVGSATTADLSSVEMRGPGGERYRYGYDANGNVVQTTDALNHTTSFAYGTTFNHLTSFTDARGNGIGYGYDARGNLTSITYADGTQETYTYDAHGNVLTATNRRGQTVAYTYNAAGQVLTKDDATTPGIDFVYTYDAAGNLTSAPTRPARRR